MALPTPDNRTPLIPVHVAQGTLVTGDNAVSFGEQVRNIIVQNNTTQTIQIEWDSPAGPGSFAVPSGQAWVEDVIVTVLHIYIATGPVPLGNAAGSVYVRGGV